MKCGTVFGVHRVLLITLMQSAENQISEFDGYMERRENVDSSEFEPAVICK